MAADSMEESQIGISHKIYSTKKEKCSNISLSLLNICPKSPLDLGKRVVLVKLQWLQGLGAREELEVITNATLRAQSLQLTIFLFKTEVTFYSRGAKRIPRQALGP